MDPLFRKTKPERPWKLPCALCGQSITSTQTQTEIETREPSRREHAMVRVWHKDCFNQFLENGEES